MYGEAAMCEPIKKPAFPEGIAGNFLKHHNIDYNETLPFCKIIPPKEIVK